MAAVKTASACLSWWKGERGKSARQYSMKLLLSAFLFFYFAFILLGQTPDGWEPRKRWYEPCRWLYRFWGLEQRWNLFSPSAPKTNVYLSFLITMDDGTKMFWQLPRLDSRDYDERYHLEMWRKFMEEESLQEDFREMLPDLTKYFARKLRLPGDKPQHISYNEWSIPIPPPSDNPVSLDNLPEHTDFKCIFINQCQPEDFDDKPAK